MRELIKKAIFREKEIIFVSIFITLNSVAQNLRSIIYVEL